MHATVFGSMPLMESIKRVRRRRGLSLGDVARESGLTRAAVARIEHPDTDPRASTLEAIATAMGVPVCVFFERKHRHVKTA